MRAILAGEGALEGLTRRGRGAVLASFSRAVYLRVSDAVIALVDAGVAPGPIHLVLDGAVPETTVGALVAPLDGRLVVGNSTIDLRDLRPWRGSHPDPGALRDAAAVLLEVVAGPASGSALGTPPYSARAERARRRLKAGDLEGAAQLLGGLGPGLTPAGDDALGALLFVRRLLEGERTGPALEAVARDIRTGDISRAFLHWAARGQVLAAGHDLVTAAARADRPVAEVAALALTEVGETSGADFALGISWALQAWG